MSMVMYTPTVQIPNNTRVLQLPGSFHTTAYQIRNMSQKNITSTNHEKTNHNPFELTIIAQFINSPLYTI